MKTVRFITFLILSFFYIGNITAQKKDLSLYENIKSFYNLMGFPIDNCGKQELESIINVKDLTENLNTSEVSLYKFNSPSNDSPSNIIIVQKDSIDIYDIFAINAILRRIVVISAKYSEISINKKDIAWIKSILELHLSAIQNVRAEAWIVEKKVGKFTYHIKYDNLDSSKK